MVISGAYFTIRDIDENEMDVLLNVYRHCEDFLALGPVSRASAQMILDDIKISEDQGGLFCGIFIGNEMVGVFDFVPAGYKGNPKLAYLSLLMISDEHRRHGIGRDAVRAVESEIRKNAEVRTILSGVQINNKPGLAFWASMGYKITGGPFTMQDTTVVYDLQKDIGPYSFDV